MTVRVAINGFGRIGGLVLRALHETRFENEWSFSMPMLEVAANLGRFG